MVLSMLIRHEQKGDYDAISMVTALAFADAEHSDQTEPEIIVRLRATDALTISLVAVDDDRLVGHVAFSPVTINGAEDGWFGLGPVSVEPDHQAKGIGSALIRSGLKQLESQGAAGCVVLGDPAYYARFGFERHDNLRYDGAPPEYFMRLLLAAPTTPSASVEYAPAFTG
jgi:putative acetyltransferase